MCNGRAKIKLDCRYSAFAAKFFCSLFITFSVPFPLFEYVTRRAGKDNLGKIFQSIMINIVGTRERQRHTRLLLDKIKNIELIRLSFPLGSSSDLEERNQERVMSSRMTNTWNRRNNIRQVLTVILWNWVTVDARARDFHARTKRKKCYF